MIPFTDPTTPLGIFLHRFVMIFLLLVGAHFISDFALQNNWMVKNRNPETADPGIDWRIVMGAHCAIHAWFVLIVTQSVCCGILEFVAHWTTDYSKIKGRLDFAGDQFLHVMYKLIWTAFVI